MEHDRAAAFNTIAIGLQSPIEKFLSEESHSSRPRNARLLSTFTSKTAPKESGVATTVSNAIAIERPMLHRWLISFPNVMSSQPVHSDELLRLLSRDALKSS